MASIKSRLLGTTVIIAIVVIVLLSSLPIVFFYVNTNTPEVEIVNGSNSSNSVLCPNGSEDIVNATETPGNCTLKCRENFFCDEKSLLCKPLCPEWNLLPSSFVTASDTVTLVFGPLGMIAGIAVLIVSFIRRKNVYVFPAVLVVYQTIALLVILLFHVMTHFDRGYLYCTSRNLMESISDSTSFCVISGMVVHYSTLQVSIWWIMNVLIFLWRVYFPIEARALNSTKSQRVLHVTCVLVALLLPLIPAVTPNIGNAIKEKQSNQSAPGTLGYGFILFPPVICTGLDANILFYTLILPVLLFVMVGTISLVLVIWKIHKEQGLFHSTLPKSSLIHVSTAEKKLLIVFTYYIFLYVISELNFTLGIQIADTLQTEVFSYFICEQNRHDCRHPCDRSGFENLLNQGILLLSSILLFLAPAVNFVFVVDYKELKQKFNNLRSSKKTTRKTSGNELQSRTI